MVDSGPGIKAKKLIRDCGPAGAVRFGSLRFLQPRSQSGCGDEILQTCGSEKARLTVEPSTVIPVANSAPDPKVAPVNGYKELHARFKGVLSQPHKRVLRLTSER